MGRKRKFCLQKTDNFRNYQQSVINYLSQKCNPKTFVNSINSNGTTIKHFILPGGTHGYSARATEKCTPSRLFSDIELPNITYLPNHWDPSLIPDLDNISNLTGNFIIVNPSYVLYSSYVNGEMIFTAGYDFDISAPKDSTKTTFFCSFEKGIQHRFNELPNSVENIIDLLKNRYNKNRNKFPELHKHFTSSIQALSSLENDSVKQLEL